MCPDSADAIPDSSIDQAGAAAAIERARDLWLSTKAAAIAHHAARQWKETWFKRFAIATLAGSLITVALSSFGFVTAPELESSQSDRERTANVQIRTETEHPNPSQPLIPPTVIWFVTGVVAFVTAGSKICEARVGRPEDIKNHLNIETQLEGKLHDLNDVAAGMKNYYDGTQSLGLEQLKDRIKEVEARVNDANNTITVSVSDNHRENAERQIRGKMIDRFHREILGVADDSPPDYVPSDAPDILIATRAEL